MALRSLQSATSRIARHVTRWWRNAQPSGWEDLQQELDRWHARDHNLAFWWRDDDAQTASPALDQLLELAGRFQMPLALAVIPAGADAPLERRLARESRVRVFQHGWDHKNHASPAEPAELSATRDAAQVRAELAEGRRRLSSLCGGRFLPVLVPPFNRLSRRLDPAIEATGFRYISSHGDFGGLPLPSRNTHLDVIDWQTNRVAEPAVIVRTAIVALKLRRYGLVRPGLPLGLVTHHLAHDGPVWSLIEEVLTRFTRHPAIRAPAIEEIFTV